MATLIDLLQANKKELSFIKDQSELLVLIHPFYTDSVEKADNNRYATKVYLLMLEQLIGEYFSEQIPFLVLQPQKSLNDLSERLDHFGDNSVFFVETMVGESTPIGGTDVFSKIVDLLKAKSIQLLTLSGLFLVNYKLDLALDDHETKYDPEGILPDFIKNRDKYLRKYSKSSQLIRKEIVPKGCVGYAVMNFLRFGIDVNISKVTAPCSGYNLIK
jgi:hypothetical protein